MTLKASPNVRQQKTGRFATKHGQYGTPEYTAWMHMKARCTNENHKQFPEYGGRGITVCEEWSDFDAFLKDMGTRPSPLHSIDRRNNSLGYSKENCRWATRKEQNRNHRGNHLLTFQGKTQCISAWSEELGMPDSVIRIRVERGWSIERALTTPRRNYPTLSPAK